MNAKTTLSLAAAAGLARVAFASTENPSIQPTPPMGFNNWARFKCELNETLFTETADAMKSKGLLAAGYDRINLDDCWLKEQRTANGTLAWDETLFPKGLIWLGQYFKSNGFKFGIYEDAGVTTCGGYPGSQGYEAVDAQTFASWGVDFVKLDGCAVRKDNGRSGVDQYLYLYGLWHDVLGNLSSPMVFSESAPAYFSGEKEWYTIMNQMPTFGELARHSGDIATFDEGTTSGLFWRSVMSNYYEQHRLARYTAPGYYNDPDFIIADFPLTLDEKKSQFALWASFSAPLIISSYIPDLTDDEVKYLTNKDIIAIDQDALGLQATLVSQDGTWDVLTKPLSNGDRLLTVLNRGDNSGKTTITFDRVGLPAGKYTVKDLWTGKSSKLSKVSISLPSHATAIYRISGIKSSSPTGMFYNSYEDTCLTSSDDGTSVSFADCKATNAQVWKASGKNTYSSLAQPKQCLTSANGSISLQPCSSSASGQTWSYSLNGTFKESSGQCLTGGIDTKKPVTLAGCSEDLWYNQIFSLPSGIKVNKI